MKITKINIENYRLLKDFSIDIEDELSLVVGKNNTGKTSILSVLDKFLNQTENISFDDFNIDFKKELKNLIIGNTISDENYKSLGIKLKLFIQYEEVDNLANISRVMMDLDPENNFVVLGFEYVLNLEAIKRLIDDFCIFRRDEETKRKEKGFKVEDTTTNSADIDLYYFLNENHTDYFKLIKKSIKYNTDLCEIDDSIFIDLDKDKIPLGDLICFKYIRANRDVSNRDINKALSSQTSKIYKKTEESDSQKKAVDKFKDKLKETDSELSNIYQQLFDTVVQKVRKFGGIKLDDSILEIISTLQHKELLDSNTTVMYKHQDHLLPEHYNGLGYMNLISMILEIEIVINDFKRKKDELPSDINLLFIEEPEAHTHPQMQYIFIKNIKGLLQEGIQREDGLNKKLQYIISTHSSHIVSECNFDDIKYLQRDDNRVISKNLKSIEDEYKINGEEASYRFLKQYLTLNRAELFFADKAILVEGDTERILLPAMMKKIDQESSENPLLSQHISIVEVGAYSKIFEIFIDFLGLKTLIITDIDSYYEEIALETDGETSKKYKNGNEKKETHKCPAGDSKVAYTANYSLLFFHDKNKEDGIQYFKNLKFEDKSFCKHDSNWIPDKKGKLLIAYQTEEDDYYARSFEDSFIHLNRQFVSDKRTIFKSLINIQYFDDIKKDAYELAESCIDGKPSFAIEILLSSDENFSNWNTPNYIKEGLLWLKD